ncbi:unnamed protein product, partial [Microthlaspi erraticum]
MFRARPNLVRPSEVSAKVQTVRPIASHDPGNYCPRSATPRHDRARPKRASRETPRGRATLAYHARTPVRAGETTPASGRRFHRPSLSPVRPQRPTTHPSTPTVPTRHKTRLSGRSSRTTV